MKIEPIISVDNLGKTYRVPEREGGMKAALGSLFQRKTRDVDAVKDISFSIQPGEVVGFLGPNGAGKTTTLKMLSGLLYPTAGTATVLGF
ncbi:MAG: ATP-binding cassette domain-containing protein, partial [Thermomicrobiales bacterium]